MTINEFFSFPLEFCLLVINKSENATTDKTILLCFPHPWPACLHDEVDFGEEENLGRIYAIIDKGEN